MYGYININHICGGGRLIRLGMDLPRKLRNFLVVSCISMLFVIGVTISIQRSGDLVEEMTDRASPKPYWVTNTEREQNSTIFRLERMDEDIPSYVAALMGDLSSDSFVTEATDTTAISPTTVPTAQSTAPPETTTSAPTTVTSLPKTTSMSPTSSTTTTTPPFRAVLIPSSRRKPSTPVIARSYGNAPRTPSNFLNASRSVPNTPAGAPASFLLSTNTTASAPNTFQLSADTSAKQNNTLTTSNNTPASTFVTHNNSSAFVPSGNNSAAVTNTFVHSANTSAVVLKSFTLSAISTTSVINTSASESNNFTHTPNPFQSTASASDEFAFPSNISQGVPASTINSSISASEASNVEFSSETFANATNSHVLMSNTSVSESNTFISPGNTTASPVNVYVSNNNTSAMASNVSISEGNISLSAVDTSVSLVDISPLGTFESLGNSSVLPVNTTANDSNTFIQVNAPPNTSAASSDFPVPAGDANAFANNTSILTQTTVVNLPLRAAVAPNTTDSVPTTTATSPSTTTTPITPTLPDFVFRDGCNVLLDDDRGVLPACSNNLFREYYSEFRGFPECGAWVGTESYGFAQRYLLDYCELQPYNWQECSLRKRFRHFLMMGDSTGWRLFMSLVNTTISMGSNCKLVKTEGEFSVTPSDEYFALNDDRLKKAFRIQNRKCGWCRAQMYDCTMKTWQGFHTVRLEFIEAYKFIDESLTVPKYKARPIGIEPARTFQEYIFNTYLPATTMPDAIVYSFPLNHEKRNKDVVPHLEYMIDLMLRSVPRTTEIYWLPTATEFESKRYKQEYINITYGRERLLAGDMIYRINTHLYETLEPFLLDPRYNMYGFVNTANMSSSKEHWCEDGVHFNYLWYSHAIRTLLSIMCN